MPKSAQFCWSRTLVRVDKPEVGQKCVRGWPGTFLHMMLGVLILDRKINFGNVWSMPMYLPSPKIEVRSLRRNSKGFYGVPVYVSRLLFLRGKSGNLLAARQLLASQKIVNCEWIRSITLLRTCFWNTPRMDALQTQAFHGLGTLCNQQSIKGRVHGMPVFAGHQSFPLHKVNL